MDGDAEVDGVVDGGAHARTHDATATTRATPSASPGVAEKHPVDLHPGEAVESERAGLPCTKRGPRRRRARDWTLEARVQLQLQLTRPVGVCECDAARTLA